MNKITGHVRSESKIIDSSNSSSQRRSRSSSNFMVITPVGTPEWSTDNCVEVWNYGFSQARKLSDFYESNDRKLTDELFNPDRKINEKSFMKNSDIWEKFPDTKPSNSLIRAYLAENAFHEATKYTWLKRCKNILNNLVYNKA